MRELAQWSFDGKIKAVTEHEDFADQTIDLGAWKATVTFGGDGRANAAPVHTKPTGKMMIVQLEENTFILIGTGCHITFQPVGNKANMKTGYLNCFASRMEMKQTGAARVLGIRRLC
jgi:hypothetical protein